jgi:hypothetical protein
MPLPKDKPDAILVPRPFRTGGRIPHTYFNARLGPVLGVARVQAASQGNQYFLRADSDTGLLFPVAHPLNPRERFRWFVVQEGRDHPPLAEPRAVSSWRDEPQTIKFGYLVDEDHVDPPGSAERAAFARATAGFEAEYRSKAVRFATLAAKGPDLDAAGREELAALRDYFEDLAEHGPPDAARA